MTTEQRKQRALELCVPLGQALVKAFRTGTSASAQITREALLACVCVLLARGVGESAGDFEKNVVGVVLDAVRAKSFQAWNYDVLLRLAETDQLALFDFACEACASNEFTALLNSSVS